MCLHAAFDLLFVGLNTGIVASIDLMVSGARMRARVRGARMRSRMRGARLHVECGND